MDSSEDDDDLIVKDCERDLQALRDACRIYGSYGDGNPSDDELCSHYDAAEDGDDEDDVILLSIQKKFGDTFHRAPLTPSFEEEDDEEILRAVQQRFASTTTRNEVKTGKAKRILSGGSDKSCKIVCSSKQHSTPLLSNVSVEEVPVSDISSDLSPNCDVNLSPAHNPEPTGFTFPGQAKFFDDTLKGISDEPVDGVVYDENLLADLSNDRHGRSIRSTLDALKKNRLLQRVLMSKLQLLQLKLEENRDLQKRVKYLQTFQSVARRKYAFEDGTDYAICIDYMKGQLPTSWPRPEGAMPFKGRPPDNPDVAKLRAMQKKYSFTFEPRIWLKEERAELVKGVKQQVQESRIRTILEMYSEDAEILDAQVKAIAENEPTPEDIRAAVPSMNWNEVARLYVVGRSPTECWIQWSNYEDPLIYHGPWTKAEDKKLWSIAKQHKLCNWDRIAQTLCTRRSIAQCLIRYQRSLNSGIMRGAWTQEEDEQLRAAVEVYGEQDWLKVAGTLEGRTGPQCWNRWHKVLHPMRQKSGRWNVDEDNRLRLAVSVYGPRMWKVIAAYVTGRTEVQCRERWCNVLDPSIKLAEWTTEEDQRLEEAVAKHGKHRWSAVAIDLKTRTDNQCWRRWKHLHPELVLVFQEDNKIQKAALVNNFVGRRKERPKLRPSDFVSEPGAFAKDSQGILKDDSLNRQEGNECKRQRKDPNVQTRELARIDTEFSKMRRAERIGKLRQARAAGRLLVWKRPAKLRTGEGQEEKSESRKRSNRSGKRDTDKSGTTAFVTFIHKLAKLCQKTEIKEVKVSKSGSSCSNTPNTKGKGSVEDLLKSGEGLASSGMSPPTGDLVSESTERDDEVEAAVKAVLSWPFIWGLEDFWMKVHG